MAKAKTTNKTTKAVEPKAVESIVEETSKKDINELIEEIKQQIDEDGKDLGLKDLVEEKESSSKDINDIEVEVEKEFDMDLLKEFIKETNDLYLGGPAQRILDKIKKSL